MTARTDPKPPSHLSPASREQFTEIMRMYALDPRHVLLLVQALEQTDRAELARRQVEKEGITVPNRWGTPQAHPAVNIERDAIATSIRLWRLLDLDGVDAEAAAKRNVKSIGVAR